MTVSSSPSSSVAPSSAAVSWAGYPRLSHLRSVLVAGYLVEGDGVAGQFFEDCLRHHRKGLLHLGVLLGTELHKLNPIFLCESPALFLGDGPAVNEVILVADEKYLYEGVGIDFDFLEPVLYVIEGRAAK